MIISKFSPGGRMLWSTYFGNGVSGRCMTVDKIGNIIAVGRLLDGTPNVPDQHSSIPLLNNGGYFDAKLRKFFISKFSNKGELLWSSYYVDFSSYPMDMSYDSNGNVYVVGWSQMWDFPVVDPGGGAYMVNNAQYGAAQVLFISQFNDADKLVWSTRIEGNDYDPSARVCTDKVGNIYIGGQARSTNYPLVNAGGYYNDAAWGAIITKFNPQRKMTWSTYYPAAFSLHDLTTDDSCNLYITANMGIVKFDSSTNLIFEQTDNPGVMHTWPRIEYDRVHDQIQVMGIMNDGYWDYSTVNTSCKGSFFDDGQFPRKYMSATGPIFATINHDGEFLYRSLADWVAEYYQYFEMTTDNNGDVVYLFCQNTTGNAYPNPELTNPGYDAYFDDFCSGGGSALLLKLTASDNLSATTQITPPVSCGCNGTATVIPECRQIPFRYKWSNGDTTATASGLCPGIYSVKVTDSNNLSKTFKVTIEQPAGGITAAVLDVLAENCNLKNGIINIQSVLGGTAPFTYSIDTSSYHQTAKFTNLKNGAHVINIKDANGCTYKDSVIVESISGPSSIKVSTQSSSCISSTGNLEVTGTIGGVAPYQYTLNTGATNVTGIFNNLASGDYRLNVADSAGCLFTQTVKVEKAIAPVNAVYNISNDHCGQRIGTIEVNSVTGGSAPYSFSLDSISFTNSTIKQLNAGNYTLFIKDINGCVLKKSSIDIINESGPVSASITAFNAYCGKQTGSISVISVLNGSVPYSYAIDNNNFSAVQNFSSVQPGVHRIQVKDLYGCIYSDSVEVKYKFTPVLTLTPADTTVCYNEVVNVMLNGNIGEVMNINWNIPAQGNYALIKADEEKRLLVTAIDSNNCVITVSGTIRAKACNTLENCVAIPAAFTPNKDGTNDKFAPIINGCHIEFISFQIYNRFGEMIFDAKKNGEGWDGSYKGTEQPAGAYIYTCKYSSDGIKIFKKGTTILIR
jgi:gliding motility-associated-like protein